MENKFFLTASMITILFLCSSCASHFGVENRAGMVPDDFGQTEAAIAHAEQSQGSQYCPDKIAQAKDLARQGAEVYWSGHNTESSSRLAEARRLAEEAERCGPAAAAAPPVPEAAREPIPAAEPAPAPKPIPEPPPVPVRVKAPREPIPAAEPTPERLVYSRATPAIRRQITPEEIRVISDRHSKELKSANYDFHFNNAMKYDKVNNERQEPTLKISLKRSFDGNVIVTGNEGEIVGKVKVGNLVEASLVSDGFNIELLYPKESDGRQVLSTDHDLDWRWSISPKTSGTLPLNLYIKDIVVLDGDKPIFQTITSLHRIVNVRATVGTEIDIATTFLDKLKQLVVSIKGLIVAMIALGGVVIYKKRKK